MPPSSTVLTRSIQAPWRTLAACQGLVSGTEDPWAPDEDATPLDRLRLEIRARTICADCPVRTACLAEAIELLPVVEEHTIRGGLTPTELRDLARGMHAPHRRVAQCGTRSAYVGGCRCDDCRNAHRRYEHERRLHAGDPRRRREQAVTLVPPREFTPASTVARRLRVGQRPKTARSISKTTGLKTTRVRQLLDQMVSDGRALVVGSSDHGAPLYVRASIQEAAHAAA